ncbi:MAG TPA: hypothetical protein VGH65_07420 [Verrucomicrobiaceae bacterium]|jgi:hypothetical protein
MSTTSATPKRLRQPGLIVYCCGLGTSALVLWLVDLLNDHGVNIMGWYINGIIPGGALLVGMVSGLGYAIGSRVLNVKLSRAFVMGMITTALADYIAAQWVTWSNLIEKHHASSDKYSFLQYVKDICEGMSFKRGGSEEPGAPLGVFGYFFKFLEMAGYAFGAMLPSAFLRGMPYCHGCQSYLKKHQTTVINAPGSWNVAKKESKKQRLELLTAAVQHACARTQEVLQSVQATSFNETATKLAALDKSANKEALATVSLTLKKCPHCDAHHVAATLSNKTADKKAAQKVIANLDKTNVAQIAAAVEK